MPGTIDELEALKPTARSPLWSIAALPIQRQTPSLGAWVLCCPQAGVPDVTPLISHQRTPERPPLHVLPLPPTQTLWLPTSASWPSEKRRYAARNIERSPSADSRDEVPACGTQLEKQSSVYAAGVRVPPTVNVEFAGVPKSAWKRQILQVVVSSPDCMTGSGAPAGGMIEPSRSAGSIASALL